MVNLTTEPNGLIGVELSGKLHDDDYRQLVPLVDAAAKAHGKVRMLVHFRNFQGWDNHALWDDVKFAATHCTVIERIALVGDKQWEQWMAKVCRPFTLAIVKYFDAIELNEAKRWLRGPAV